MKVDFVEHPGCFEIQLTAENPQEAAGLVRMGMNQRGRGWSSLAYQSGTFASAQIVKKRKDANTVVPNRR